MTPTESRAIDRLILELHAQASRLPAGQWGPAALQACQPWLGFDSGLFASGAVDAQGRERVDAFELYRQPVDKIADRANFRGHDPVLMRGLRQPGRLAQLTATDLPPQRQDLLRHARRFDAHHTLFMAQPAGDGAMGAVSLWYGRRNPPGAAQQAMAERLLPHLGLAWHHHALWHGLAPGAAGPLAGAPAASAGGVGAGCSALASPAGHLLVASAAVVACLRREWPQWLPPWLPPALQGLLAGLPAQRLYRGRQLLLAAQPQPGGLLRLQIEVQPAAPAVAADARLTAAEWRVAALVAQGLSYKAAAQRLQRSPATVRNQLQRVYDKLGLRDKTALALAWARGAGGPPPDERPAQPERPEPRGQSGALVPRLPPAS